MMEAWRIADLHAYVDDCLEPDERLAFERQMAQDAALARRAMLWRAQNSAIRTAFDIEGARAFSISIVRHQNETLIKAGRSAAVDGKSSRDGPMRQSPPAGVEVSRFSAKVPMLDAFRPWPAWRVGLAALSAFLALVWAPAATVVPAQELGEAGVAAFQAFARPWIERVEFATSDRTEAQTWLTARLMHSVTLPKTPSAIRLMGAWVAPFPGSPAAFLVYKSQDRLVGLLTQSLDAPATGAPQLLAVADGRSAAVWTWRGQGFALVGDPDAASLLQIATDFFELPIEAAQTAPERGW
jgi:anti-sigma factor RsiW